MYPFFFKRVIDFVSALCLLLMLSWLFVIVILGYFISFEMPIFFTQKRIGKNNASFTIIKFRTLLENENDSNEQRRFWWGNVLRFFSIDELPQLWNVLIGEMSLIGPRPLPIEYLSLMDEQQRERHNVRPGITGWTQVNGRTDISWEKKFQLDEYYIKHLSFGLDMKIILKTIALLLSFSKDNSLTEKKFEGTVK